MQGPDIKSNPAQSCVRVYHEALLDVYNETIMIWYIHYCICNIMFIVAIEDT